MLRVNLCNLVTITKLFVATSGLGLQTSGNPDNDIGWSAGDYISCCGTPARHGNTSAAFQLFGRYMSESCEFSVAKKTTSLSQTTKVAQQKHILESPYLSLDGGHLKLSDVANLDAYTIEYWCVSA